MVHMGRTPPTRRPVQPVFEPLEPRVVMSGGTIASGMVPWLLPHLGHGGTTLQPHIQVDKSFLVFNDVRGGSAGPNVTLTLRNTGTAALSLSSFTVTGGDASQFAVTGRPGATLAAALRRI